jgi:hypothetical protein
MFVDVDMWTVFVGTFTMCPHRILLTWLRWSLVIPTNSFKYRIYAMPRIFFFFFLDSIKRVTLIKVVYFWGSISQTVSGAFSKRSSQLRISLYHRVCVIIWLKLLLVWCSYQVWWKSFHLFKFYWWEGRRHTYTCWFYKPVFLMK